MTRARLSASIASAILCALSPAARAERKNPLEGQPAIRHRVELRKLRFEVTPFVGFTLLQDFNNTILGGAKLNYHLTDWLAIGGVFGGGVPTDTGLKNQVLSTLDSCPPPALRHTGPTQCDAADAMNHIAWMATGQAEFIPVSGKLSLFGRAFFNYDFYVDGGVGFVNLASDLKNAPSDCSSRAMGNTVGCNTGLKVGPTVAAGVHMFLTNYMALQFEYRGIIISDNAAGRDVNGDMSVNDDDLRLSLKNFVTVGLAFFLPPTAELSP
jgi:outer membrane beta-barrel protein